MIFEFSNDLVPILLTTGLYLTFIAVHLINGITKEFVVKRRSITNDHLHSFHISVSSDQLVLNEFVEKQSFLTRIVKRKEAPEDDADYPLSSLYYKICIKRGGQQWKAQSNLYSTSLNDTAFLFSSPCCLSH
nr:hypothetical protein [Evansella caseinilytica]